MQASNLLDPIDKEDQLDVFIVGTRTPTRTVILYSKAVEHSGTAVAKCPIQCPSFQSDWSRRLSRIGSGVSDWASRVTRLAVTDGG